GHGVPRTPHVGCVPVAAAAAGIVAAGAARPRARVGPGVVRASARRASVVAPATAEAPATLVRLATAAAPATTAARATAAAPATLAARAPRVRRASSPRGRRTPRTARGRSIPRPAAGGPTRPTGGATAGPTGPGARA